MTKTENKRTLCLKCFRSVKNCFCKYIKPFDTNTHFVLLMHPIEAYKMKTGTGRLSNVALKNSEIIVGIDFTENKRVNSILNDKDSYSMILYPGIDSINVSRGELSKGLLDNRKLSIFLIDSTWYYSKKILRLSRNLQTLPKISFNSEYKSQFIFKKQPSEECLSTIESIYYFLDECDKHGIESVGNNKGTLLDVFNRMVDFQLKCEADPSLDTYRREQSLRKRKMSNS